MQHIELKGQIRQAGNEACVKALRRQGLVPCNLYGNGLENVLFTVNAQDLKAVTNTPASYIVDLTLDNGEKYEAILHEAQWHPVTDEALHIDFLAVSADIKWNFTKFLVNKKGQVVARFEPTTSFDVIAKAIEEWLQA